MVEDWIQEIRKTKSDILFNVYLFKIQWSVNSTNKIFFIFTSINLIPTESSITFISTSKDS